MERIRRGLAAYQKISRPEQEKTAAEAKAAGDDKPEVRPPVFPRFTAASEPVPPSVTQSAPPVKEKKAFLKTSKDGSLRKVAKFLILLGKDEAVKVVRHLEKEQIEALGKEIAGIKKIEPVEAEHILKEFGYIAGKIEGPLQGGKEMAKSILDGAFGPDRAVGILRKSVPGAVPKPFAFLNDLDGPALGMLLAGESVLVLSIVLPHLEGKKGAAVLKTLPADRRLDLVKRLAKMEKVARDIVVKVEEGLREKARNLNPGQTEEIDGKSRLADILRFMSMDKEEHILRGMEESNRSLGTEIRRRLFTADQLMKIHDSDFEELLRQKTETQLALIWKGVGEDLRAKMERNISGRRMLMVQAELDILGDAADQEVKREVHVFLEEVREAVREGRAVLLDGSDDYV